MKELLYLNILTNERIFYLYLKIADLHCLVAVSL